MEKQKFCDSTRRPINKNCLLTYTRTGTTYLCRVVDLLEDFSETNPEKWIGWNYSPGKVVIELLENPWDSSDVLYQRILIVDSRLLTIVKEDVLFGANNQRD